MTHRPHPRPRATHRPPALRPHPGTPPAAAPDLRVSPGATHLRPHSGTDEGPSLGSKTSRMRGLPGLRIWARGDRPAPRATWGKHARIVVQAPQPASPLYQVQPKTQAGWKPAPHSAQAKDLLRSDRLYGLREQRSRSHQGSNASGTPPAALPPKRNPTVRTKRPKPVGKARGRECWSSTSNAKTCEARTNSHKSHAPHDPGMLCRCGK